MFKLSRLLACGALILAVSACSLIDKIKPHKIEIRQGNYVTQEMVSQLKSGMSMDQVRFIMGTPLVTDPFHTDRWDYVYRLLQEGKVTEQRRITLKFKDSKLESVEGDVVAAIVPPAQSEPAAP